MHDAQVGKLTKAVRFRYKVVVTHDNADHAPWQEEKKPQLSAEEARLAAEDLLRKAKAKREVRLLACARATPSSYTQELVCVCRLHLVTKCCGVDEL